MPSRPTNRDPPESPCLQFGVWWAWVALLLFIVSCATTRWTVTYLEVPERRDPRIERGLFGMSVFDGYSTRLFVAYDIDDENGDRADPYCGDAAATSIFENRALEFLFRGVPVKEDLVTAPVVGRDNNVNNWCDKKDAAAGLAIAAAILCAAAAVFPFCARGLCGTTLFVITCILSGLVGLTVTAIIGDWIVDTRDGEADAYFNIYELPLVDLTASWSFGLFTTAWVIMLFASIMGCMHMCALKAKKNRKNIAYTTASQPIGFSTV